ncbi:DUF896 domain-containing protein [Fructilactobacillus fructivorans]|uniref:UPF0291 protein LF543_03895 n=1 Tax=Fructilactobacillus fructivorans TaxID=1614 RepID=A0A0C1PMV3_9LACO|nr:DUF896 domain-containing protein [Fructilactobacillus fructivorans]KID41236.1 hypothetical protein LfDm3_1081 [Fructilactobacillus fructivorans]KRK58754.1 hypothetical protein FC73_GL000309 [Fructilactobacillus fructivorans]KRN13665.1 hypothetical protein IV37_GL000389 [Fructilactobacillus fructivorans]KRN39634.1 hypothetical protein IV51_GL001001 [Fructilactobacillus fructivorans]KRN43355.1 hypothetical protein IV48_GL000588 [Fructilactobacillus fructivorans]
MTEDKELEKLIPRINELSKKSKQEGLSEDEKEEQNKLRKEYLERFKANFKSQIEMTKVYDKKGNEITSDKVKDSQRKKNLRDD